MKVTQSCSTLCDPIDYTVHRILQARILEWVAFPFSRGSSQPRDPSQVSHIAGKSLPAEPQGKLKNTGMGSLSLLQGIFLIQESNGGLLLCRQILYQLSYRSSVHFSCSVVSDSLWPHEPQHARAPCPSPIPRVYSNSCLLSQWCHPTISSSVVPFSCLGFPNGSEVKNPPAMQETWFDPWVLKIAWRRRCNPLQYSWASLAGQLVKNLAAMWETWVRPLGWEDPLE